jgi:hypothetical protein
MNFYNEEEKKEGAPAVPGSSTFKKTASFGKSPLFSRASGGIMDRLKNLSRKDMALVGIGLSVLVTAPVAEYMMSKPSTENPVLTPGFGSRDDKGAPNSLYEPGINALSQGSPDGSGEVITPLSSRDPSSLILGSQPAQPVMPVVSAPPPASNLRDAMKDAGRNAFSEATKSAGAPTPIPRMAAALRNFGTFFTGGEGSRTTGGGTDGKIMANAKSASGKAAGRNMVGPVGLPGFKGVASNTPNGSSKGAFEKLRSQADKSAGNFNGDSAIRSLDKAAADAVDIGNGHGGLGAGGDSDKTTKPSGNTTKYNHDRSGESLEEMAARQRMQKALEWESYKKYEIPKQFINAIITGITGPLTDYISDGVKHMLKMDGSAPAKYCWIPAKAALLGTAEQPNAQDARNCKDGAVQSGVVNIGPGKESTGQGYKMYCPCGYAHDPVGGPAVTASGDPAGGTSTQTNAQTAVANLSTLDDLLKQIVDRTAEAAGSPKNKDTVTGAAKSVIDAFQRIPGTSDKVLGTLNDARGKAKDSFDGFSSGITRARGSFTTTQGEYNDFLKKVNTLEKDTANNCAAVKMKNLQAKAGETSTTVTATLPLDRCTSIKGKIAVWKENAAKGIDYVSGAIVLHEKALGTYQTQLGYVNDGIDKIQKSYQTVSEKFGGLNLQQAAMTDVEPAVKALNQMTGQLDKEPAVASSPAPVDGVPMKFAADMRGANWTKIWDKKHVIDSSDATTAEQGRWSKVQAALSAGTDPVTADTALAPDLVSNQLRSGEIVDSIAGRSPDFARITAAIGSLETGMATLRMDADNAGIDSSYLGGVTNTNPTPTPKPDGVDPGTSTPKPNGDANTGEAAGKSNLVSTAGSERTMNNLIGAARTLPATSSDPRYAEAKKNADASIDAASAALGRMKTAQDTLASPTASAEAKAKAQKDYAAAKADFDTQAGAANSNIEMARTLHTNPKLNVDMSSSNSSLSPSQKTHVAAAKTIISACYTLANGAHYPQSQCGQVTAGRIYGMLSLKDESSLAASTVVSTYDENAATAFGLIKGCRKDLSPKRIANAGCHRP